MHRTSSGFRRAARVSACVLLGTALLAACDNGPKSAATVTLSVPSTNLVVGQHVQITPTVKDADGKVLTGRTVQYTSSAPTVVSVTSAGEIVALSQGAGTITATVEAATANVGIVVAPVPVDHVAVSPDTATFAAATSKQLTATALDAAGNTLFDRAVTWSVSDTSIASVSATGLVSGKKAGSVTVTATIEGKTGQARLTLTQAAVNVIEVTPGNSRVLEGTTIRLTATARDANGRVIATPTLSWRSSSTSVATVDNTGLVTGVATGYTNIIVTGGNAFGSAIVFVQPLVIGSVVISPDSARLDIGATTQLTATVKDTAGNVVTNKPVFWSSLDNTIATVSATGLVTAVATGSTGIVAVRDGVADTVTINVNPPPPPPAASVTVLPAQADLGLGRTGSFHAVVRDSLGNVFVRPLVWLVSDTTIATVDPSTGLLVARGLGTTTVHASAGPRSGSSTLNVVSTTAETITASTANLTMNVGEVVQVSATVRDGTGSILTNRLVSFSTGNANIATVDADGRITAVHGGIVIISVTCEATVATIIVTVH